VPEVQVQELQVRDLALLTGGVDSKRKIKQPGLSEAFLSASLPSLLIVMIDDESLFFENDVCQIRLKNK
jgi:hypothetical protein